MEYKFTINQFNPDLIVKDEYKLFWGSNFPYYEIGKCKVEIDGTQLHCTCTISSSVVISTNNSVTAELKLRDIQNGMYEIMTLIKKDENRNEYIHGFSVALKK